MSEPEFCSQAMVVAAVLLAIGAVYVGLRTPRVISALDDQLDADITDVDEAEPAA